MKNLTLNDVKHPIYAFAIVALVGLVLHGGAEWANIWCALMGAGAAEVALFGKDIYDKVIKKTMFDWKDVKLGQIGIILGFLCVWLFM